MRHTFGITGPSIRAFKTRSRILLSHSSSSSSDLSIALGRETVRAIGSSSAAADASASSVRVGKALDMFSHSDRPRCESASAIVCGVSTVGLVTTRSPHSWRMVYFCSGESLPQVGSSASRCSPFCHAASQSAWTALRFCPQSFRGGRDQRRHWIRVSKKPPPAVQIVKVALLIYRAQGDKTLRQSPIRQPVADLLRGRLPRLELVAQSRRVRCQCGKQIVAR